MWALIEVRLQPGLQQVSICKEKQSFIWGIKYMFDVNYIKYALKPISVYNTESPTMQFTNKDGNYYHI